MRWRGRTHVERVDLYTRQSLHLLQWGFVGYLLVQAWAAASDRQPWTTLVTIAALLTAAAGTVVLNDVMALHPARAPLPWRSLAPFLVLVLALLALGAAQPDELRGTAVMVAFFCASLSLGGLVATRVVAVLLTLLAVIPAAFAGKPWGVLVGLAVAAFLVFTVRVSLWLLSVVVELDQARTAQASLAVAEERLRFSRDVHDVLGRRLSTIAVQAELAATLAARGDEQAPERMLEVRSTAHTALREARELARGYRPTDLSQELEGARSLLASAGIEAEVTVEGLPPAWQEPAAWVIREAVTNVLRHSSATDVTIRWESPRLCISNNGAEQGVHAEGTGLRGLRERLAPLGGAVEHRIDSGTFHLLVYLPAEAPAPSDLTERR